MSGRNAAVVAAVASSAALLTAARVQLVAPLSVASRPCSCTPDSLCAVSCTMTAELAFQEEKKEPWRAHSGWDPSGSQHGSSAGAGPRDSRHRGATGRGGVSSGCFISHDTRRAHGEMWAAWHRDATAPGEADASPGLRMGGERQCDAESASLLGGAGSPLYWQTRCEAGLGRNPGYDWSWQREAERQAKWRAPSNGSSNWFCRWDGGAVGHADR